MNSISIMQHFLLLLLILTASVTEYTNIINFFNIILTTNFRNVVILFVSVRVREQLYRNERAQKAYHTISTHVTCI